MHLIMVCYSNINMNLFWKYSVIFAFLFIHERYKKFSLLIFCTYLLYMDVCMYVFMCAGTYAIVCVQRSEDNL